jgi:hypothetical protein
LFDAHPEPRLRTRLLLRRWLWRASLAQRLGGATASLRQHVDAVTEHSEDDSVQNLLALTHADPEVATLGQDERFRSDSARTRLALCALASLEPRDLVTGEAFGLSDLFPSGKAPDFPVAYPHGEGRARALANRFLHPHLSPAKLREALDRADDVSLASHAVPPAAKASLGDQDEFLAVRDARLRQVVGDFFRAEAEFGADDSPSLDSMMVDEDG